MKTRLITIALGALVMLAGCSRSEVAPDVTKFRLSARIEADATRTTFDSEGKFAWEAGDAVALHLSTAGYASASVDTDGDFTLTVPSGNTRDGYAIYPAAVAAGTAAAPSVTLPLAYSIVSDLSSTSAPLPMVAVNDPDSDILYFHHVGGLMRITVATVPAGVRAVTVTLNGRRIAGTFTVADPGTVTPTISTATVDAGDVVSFAVSEAGLSTAATNVVLNLPVPCGTYESLTVDVTPTQSPFPKTITDNMVLDRAQGMQIKVTP